MSKDRTKMTARVVSLTSAAAGDPRMGGTAAARVAAVAQLTSTAWTLAKRPLPAYTRATMPVVVTTLAAHTTAD
jgi:hypothetical protein